MCTWLVFRIRTAWSLIYWPAWIRINNNYLQSRNRCSFIKDQKKCQKNVHWYKKQRKMYDLLPVTIWQHFFQRPQKWHPGSGSVRNIYLSGTQHPTKPEQVLSDKWSTEPVTGKRKNRRLVEELRFYKYSKLQKIGIERYRIILL
jgi:hypothetical protein